MWYEKWYVIQKIDNYYCITVTYMKDMAEGVGFEPTLGGYPKHAFQACALSHSAIPPVYRRFTCCPKIEQESLPFPILPDLC